MGISLEILDLDKDYHNQSLPGLIINEIDDTDKEQADNFNKMIYTVFDGEVTDTVISCDCGAITSQMNHGAICKNCGTPAIRRNGVNMDSALWLRTPIGCAPMINPKILWELDLNFVISGFQPIKYIVDTQYRPKMSERTSAFIDWMYAQGFRRGYTYFYENYDHIIATLLAHKHFKKKADDLSKFLTQYRDVTFINYIPLPNKSLMIIEENSTGIYREKSIEAAIDACRTVVGIDLDVKGYTQKVRENRMVKAIYLLASFVEEYISKNVKGKFGSIRKHVIAARTYWTSRTVISSITEPHRYDELHIPWGVGVGMLKTHLQNKLHRMGMTPTEVVNFLDTYSHQYHPLLDKLFKELIAESPDNGLAAFHCRNPSLLRGSILQQFITQVKSDPSDQTTGIPIIAIKSLNADFDGDQTSVQLNNDNWMTEKGYAFAPHQSVMDSGRYRQLTDAFAMTKPFALNVGRWYREQTTVRNQEQEDFIAELQ